MNDIAFFIGMICGAYLLFLVFALTPGLTYHDGDNAIRKCEKSIPRDQHCVLYASPSKDQ